MQQRIEIDQLTISAFQQKIAGYMVCTDHRQQWYMANAILLIINYPELNQLIQQKYGDKYPALIKQLKQDYATLDKIKFLLDITDKRSLTEQDLKSQTFKEALKARQDSPVINTTLTHLFLIICENTNIGLRSIPKEYTRIYELTYKKIELKPEEKYKQNTTNTNTTPGGENK